jgi:methylated-DNA-protein-cysteine methyltransferase-like protein
VATYGQIAAVAGLRSQARLVGYALHVLPEGSRTPWHRVINARGQISLPRHDGLYELQKSLLRAEGVAFDGERVDLGRYGWRGGTARQTRRMRIR